LGRVVGLLLAALFVGLALQAWVGARLQELEAFGEPGEAAERARLTLRLLAVGTLAVALGLGGVLAGLSLRTIRSAQFPPPGADWLGARRRYEGAPARRVGGLGLFLSGVLLLASLAGLTLAWLAAGGGP
jgi:hypothetical protein